MAATEEIKVVITGQNKSGGAFKEAWKDADTFEKKLNTLKPAFAGMAAVGTAAFAGIAAFSYKSIQAAQESAEVQAQLNAVLKSTGGVAGVTAEEVNKLAQELQRVTRFSDEQITSGQNLLLTFTKIGKDVFPDATKTMLDMSVALGQDLKSSAVQLGKALNDPILGVTALRRVGVAFTEEQQEMIKSLVESGKLLEAQTFILKELQTEFGGSAEAAGQTFGGQLDILKNRLNDVQETIGVELINALSDLLAKLQPVIDKVAVWIENNPVLVKTILVLGGAIAGLTAAIGALGLAMIAFQAVSFPVIGIVLAVGAAISALILIGYLLIRNWDEIKTKMQEQGWLLDRLKVVWDELKIAWEKIKTTWEEDLKPALLELNEALTPFKPLLEVIIALFALGLVQALVDVLEKVALVIRVFGEFVSIAGQVEKVAIKALGSAFDWLARKIEPVLRLAERLMNTLSSIPGAGKMFRNVPTFAGGEHVGDAVITPQGKVIHTDPADFLFATKNPASLAGSGMTINVNNPVLLDATMVDKMAEELSRLLRQKIRV